VRATVLTPGKGWVLAILAMLGPSGPPRGSGLGAPRGAALALRCALWPPEDVGTKGVPPQRRPRSPTGLASNKGLTGKVQVRRASLPSCPAPQGGHKDARKVAEGVLGLSS